MRWHQNCDEDGNGGSDCDAGGEDGGDDEQGGACVGAKFAKKM